MLQNYLKVIMRNVFRHKGYSIINLLGLAVGMTSCILIMLYVQDEFSYDQYAKYPERVYRIAIDMAVGDRGDRKLSVNQGGSDQSGGCVAV